MTRQVLILTTILGLLFAAGCASVSREEAQGKVNPTLTIGTYIEDGNLLTLVVGTRAARQRADAPYVPVEFALAIKGIKGVTLTRESFTLVDDAGNRYPVIGPDELRENYRNVDNDRRLLGDILPAVNTRFLSYNRIPSNFSPGFDDTVDRPRLNLPRYNWAYDFLYFPKPDGGVRGRIFELHMEAPELPQTIIIKFKID